MPKLENFLNYKAKIIIEIAWRFLTKTYSLKTDWMSFSVEILGKFQTAGYGVF